MKRKKLSRNLMNVIISVPVSMMAQWNSNSAVNNSICVQPYNQQNAKIVPDENGGAVIVWEDYRNDPTQQKGDIYAQRIDKNGYIRWNMNGVPICNHPAHQSNPNIDYNNGNIIIIWNDNRNGNTDIYAQMIDTSGSIKWANNGIPVISKAYSQKNGKVALSPNNDTYIVFEDSSAGQWDIYAQKLNAMGIQQWTSNGALVCNAGNTQINPRLELSPNGGMYVVWQDKRNGVDYDIYAQKLDINGNRQWNPSNNGIFVCSTIGTQNNPKIDPFNNGCIIVWQDKRNGADYDVYAQYINDNGISQWTTNGKPICTAIDNQSAIDVKSNGIDGAYIAWKDKRSGLYSDIYMQKINYAGNVVWINNGIVISNANYEQINPNIAIDVSGNAIITWQDSSAGNWDIYTAKINSNGSILWKTLVTNAIDDQTDPKNITTNDGGTIVVWKDQRNLSNKADIYAQKIFSNGSLNNVSEINNNLKVKLWPNPAHNYIYLQMINHYHKQYNIQICNILGEKIKDISSSMSLEKMDVSDISPGIYFLNIQQNDALIYSIKWIKL